ncbi:permease-like protein [Paenibacillus larvae subsp. larvae B-3650]|nr:permease-like protein [Paenibacillus larvae subsp. larvae B-3650]
MFSLTIFIQRYYRTIIDILLVVLALYLGLRLLGFLYSIAAPLFWSFVIFLMIEPFARFLNRKGLRKGLATTISTFSFIILILAFVTVLGLFLTNQVASLIEKIPGYANIIQHQIAGTTTYIQKKMQNLPPDTLDKFQEFANNLTETATKFTTAFLKGILDFFKGGLLSFFTSFSGIMVNFVVGIILAFFLSLEIESWKKGARRKISPSLLNTFTFLKENVGKGVSGYIKSQLILVSITFVIVLVSLIILRVENALSLSIMAGVIDVLPLLGISAFFIPWIIYLFIINNYPLAIALSIVLGITLLVRQIMEPKITGQALGVSPFTMFAFMIVSLSVFGVFGFIISPVLLITLKALYKEGYFHRLIRLPGKDYPVD